jgi:hypothetical protein
MKRYGEMKLLLPIKAALFGMMAILILSQGRAQGAEDKSHVVQSGNTILEYFRIGKGETVVLLPGGGLKFHGKAATAGVI